MVVWRTSVWEAWRAMASARSATVSSILIITLCLTILGFIGLVALALHRQAEEARRWITVEVFIKDDASETAVQEMRAALVRMPTVLDAHLVTKQEAVERFQQFFDDDLITALETNPLPRSLLITIAEQGRTPASLEKLVAEVRTWPEVEAIHADIEWMTTLNRLVGGAAIVLILLLVSVGVAVSIVIARTIGLGISARLTVVEVQRLLGAPESFVRRPFVLVGLIQGTIGGAAAGLIVVAASHFVGIVPLVGEGLRGAVAQVVALDLLILGVVLGWWGSRSAMATTLPPDPWLAPPERER